MSNIVAPFGQRRARKYLNLNERQRFLGMLAEVPTSHRLFVETLAWTGARISEVLALTPASLDAAASTVTLRTLKRRRMAWRDVPIPPALMFALASHFNLAEAQADTERSSQRLWTFCRVTGWRIVKVVMTAAQIPGARATPRGLRHAFGVGTLQAGVPITLLQRWMGHARLTTTAIYADVIGPEEIEFALRFWRRSM